MIRRAFFTFLVVGLLNLAFSESAQAQQRGAQPGYGQQAYSQQAAFSQAYAQQAAAQAAYSQQVNSQRAYGRTWGGLHSNHNWNRFYHYPYVYYPHNYYGQEYYKSADHLYYRYPKEMRIPVYNKKWHNYYPNDRAWHWGHQFMLDVF